MPEIANAALRVEQVPLSDADWGTIGAFALTFNGYEHWGSFDACSEQANLHRTAWEDGQTLPASLTDLRTSLFFEQRRWRHYGYDPDESSMRYIVALVDAIRTNIAQGCRT